MKKVVSLILVVALFAGLAVFASADGVAVVHNQGEAPLYVEVQKQIEHGEGTWHACADLNNWPGTLFVLDANGNPIGSGICGNVPGDGPRGAGYADGQAYASALVAASAQMTQILVHPEGWDLTWTKCAEAITVKELQDVIDSDDDINNLTVFYQRNVKSDGGELRVNLWPCNPAIRKNQAVVVLFKDADGWKVAEDIDENKQDKIAQVTLEGDEVAFAVCMAW